MLCECVVVLWGGKGWTSHPKTWSCQTRTGLGPDGEGLWEENLWKDQNPVGLGGGNPFSPETTDPGKCPATSKIPSSGAGSLPANVYSVP